MLYQLYPQQVSGELLSIGYSVLHVHSYLLLTVSQDGSAALHAACQEGHAQVAELLLQAGASVEQETKVRLSVGF